jgi:aerotaxis receptor
MSALPEPAMGATELFFSTTDPRGVIRQANSVFVRISGYSLDELEGAPHNIVRHPGMPAGVFQLMWDRLTRGRSVGAFVRNRTKDGSSYWVFAAMTPLGDGYLSVRLSPRSTYLDLVEEVYRTALVAEELARRNGAHRRDSALTGATRIEESLRRCGFGSYDEFMFAALPQEFAARAGLASAIFARPRAYGPIAEVLAGAGAVDAELAGLIARLAAYQSLCDRMADAASQLTRITHHLDSSVATARAASEPVAAALPVLANVARVMGEPMRDAAVAVAELRTALDRLRADVAHLRFRISLAALYNTMVAGFAAEVVDGTAPPRSLRAVPLLCEAAAVALMEMSDQIDRVNGELCTVADITARAGTALDRFRRFLGQWRILVSRHQAAAVLRKWLDPIDVEITAGWEWMQLLQSLGRESHSATVSFDLDPLRTRLTAVMVAADAVA